MSRNDRLSLVAHFDDLCRFSSVFTENSEPDFLTFVLNQEECRKRWMKSELELQRMHAVHNKTLADINVLETKMKHCRNTLAHEMEKRKQVEQERDALERQLSLIKEILLDSNAVNDQTREKLAFLNTAILHGRREKESPRHLITIDESAGSILSPSDIDMTEEDLDAPSMRTRRRTKSDGKKRPSAPILSDDTPPKKTKINEVNAVYDGNESIIATTTVTVPPDGPITASSKIESICPQTKLNRSYSEPAPPTQQQEVKRVPFKSDGGGGDDSDVDLLWTEPETAVHPNIGRTPLIRKKPRLSIGKISTRAHDFITKTVLKPEKCITCDKRIKFGKLALRCRECRTTCHTDCKDRAPLPCTPNPNTPGSKGLSGALVADYAPKIPPLIPPLILYCVMEVESRGLTEIGIYRVPGAESQVRDLKEKFLRGKAQPKLTKVDIHTICGCIKDFLRSLKEPLVTLALWHDFVKASESQSEEFRTELLKTAFEKLPQANRDTLAYMIMHLQLVSKSPECKMNARNLAMVFGCIQ